MSFESFRTVLGTSDTHIYQMPAYEKTEEGEYAILPKSGAIRLSIYNSSGASVDATLKLKTIFDLAPVTIGVISVDAGEVVQYPVPVSMGPGDTIVGAGSTGSVLTISGTVAASPIAPQTANGENIWTAFTMRRPIDHTLAWAIASRTYGAAAAGGYFAGMIDTVAGTIDAADAYQTGQEFALLVSPKSMERAPGLKWCAKATDSIIANAKTRWDGLAATDVLIALNDSDYEVADYIEAERVSDPAPATESGSDWYLPAMDELELMYRNLKPNDANNRTDSQAANGGAFPSPLSTHGVNPSSDPVGTAYTNSPRDPDETPLALFKAGGSQVLSQLYYWSATEAAGGATQGRAWAQNFTSSGSEGAQNTGVKASTGISVRPARRVVL